MHFSEVLCRFKSGAFKTAVNCGAMLLKWERLQLSSAVSFAAMES